MICVIHTRDQGSTIWPTFLQIFDKKVTKTKGAKENIYILDFFVPWYLIFGIIKDADNIYYCTKNQVRGLCLGGNMVIIFFGSFLGEMTI